VALAFLLLLSAGLVGATATIALLGALKGKAARARKPGVARS
jgi:hypothetical protein